MKTFKQYSYRYLFFLGLLGLAACKPEINSFKPSKGTADFSRYISIGNSLTAGYADGGLYREGQLNSYPSIIAKQMLTVGGGAFTQPLFTTAQANGSGYLRLAGFNPDGTPITAPVTTNLALRDSLSIPNFGKVALYAKYSGDNNNYGVPGIKLLQLTYAPYGNLNGFFERLLPGNSPTNNTSYLDFIKAKPFTFFSNWLGNNDALGYATSGGAGDVLTDKNTFAYLYGVLIDSLTKKGAKGVVATIPNVTAVKGSTYSNSNLYKCVGFRNYLYLCTEGGYSSRSDRAYFPYQQDGTACIIASRDRSLWFNTLCPYR